MAGSIDAVWGDGSGETMIGIEMYRMPGTDTNPLMISPQVPICKGVIQFIGGWLAISYRVKEEQGVR